MLWEGRALRDIGEADVRRLIDSGLQEHLQLEYKSALYLDGERGRREFLLDVAMFANTAGGILLIGVAELRDEQGQPTGVPDPGAVLGLDITNPEAVLGAYDARVMEAIEERLPLESAAIDVGDGRRVLALRIPNSTRKPHSVRHEGHIYFPARRERQRYHMNVREIKEVVMRTTSRLEQAQQILKSAFLGVARSNDLPYSMVGIIPIFFEDFLVDARNAAIRQAVGEFGRAERPQYRDPVYTFDGIERAEERFEYNVRFGRNGILTSSMQLPLHPGVPRGEHVFHIPAIDIQLRRFVLRARVVYEAAGIGGPYLVGMMLRTQRPLVGAHAGPDGFEYHTEPIPQRDYLFPFLQVGDLVNADPLIRPVCDQASQMFGLERSPSFDAQGVWIGRYA